MSSGVDALDQSAGKACDLARATGCAGGLRDASAAKLWVFGLAKIASSRAVLRAMAWTARAILLLTVPHCRARTGPSPGTVVGGWKLLFFPVKPVFRRVWLRIGHAIFRKKLNPTFWSFGHRRSLRM